MSDIFLYQQSPASYEDLQQRRPDYTGAIATFRTLAKKYLGDKKNIVVADFCCGTGKNSRLLAQDLSVSKAILIDTNKTFLEIATNSNINTLIETQNIDILKALLKAEADAVISMFAYHHVPDEDKHIYVEQIRSASKIGGILILGEIYTPDKETTRRYYQHLLEQIGINSKRKELEEFLTQTAESSDFEYKVSRAFAHKQLQDAGFTLLESRKIWPTDGSFQEDVGTFVEVWKTDTISA